MLILDLIDQGIISENTVGILSGSILGEAQQVQLTGLVVTHLQETIELFSSNLDETVENIDESDSSVSPLMSKVLQ